MEDKKPMGLYIHIPFCSSKCDYCDFVSYSMDGNAQREYLGALYKEIDRLKVKYVGREFDSIYIGGGTPSVVYEGFIQCMLRKVFSCFHFAKDTEVSIEVNPASFTKEKFIEYLEAGVNRISVGVQCLNSKMLANNGRVQTIENIDNTFKILTDGQYPNVSADVMMGLGGQKASSVMQTIQYLVKNKVKHLSIYSLQLEKHTLLNDKVRQNQIKLMSEKRTLKLYQKVSKYLQKVGFVRYELSNFARPGFECRHNKKYWNETEYLGLGVSAHSFIDGYRYYNTKRLDTYIDNLNNNKSPVYQKEYIPESTRRIERIMLSLRTNKGLNLDEFKHDFGEDLLKSRENQINKLLELKMIEIVDGYLRITEKSFYVSNAIILELI